LALAAGPKARHLASRVRSTSDVANGDHALHAATIAAIQAIAVAFFGPRDFAEHGRATDATGEVSEHNCLGIHARHKYGGVGT
jgi:hypothetical protein